MKRRERKEVFFNIHCSQTVNIPTVWIRVTASCNRCSCTEVSGGVLIYSICWGGLHVPGMQPVVTHGFMSSWVLLSSSKHTISFHEKKKKRKKKSPMGQWAITLAWQQVTTYIRWCQVFPDRVNPASTSDAVRGISIWGSVLNQRPDISYWKISTAVTPNSYKIGNLIFQEFVVIPRKGG